GRSGNNPRTAPLRDNRRTTTPDPECSTPLPQRSYDSRPPITYPIAATDLRNIAMKLYRVFTFLFTSITTGLAAALIVLLLRPQLFETSWLGETTSDIVSGIGVEAPFAQKVGGDEGATVGQGIPRPLSLRQSSDAFFEDMACCYSNAMRIFFITFSQRYQTGGHWRMSTNLPSTAAAAAI
ncbi:MAG: hypothetical protein P8Y40_01275, partial [Desulfobacterales bacterium]